MMCLNNSYVTDYLDTAKKKKLDSVTRDSGAAVPRGLTSEKWDAKG